MQIFHRSTNTISRATIFGAIFIVAVLLWASIQFQRSPYVTYAEVARPQPAPFSHQHHVAGLGIDCRYCHTSVETSSFAGIPATETCMTCHSQLWTEAPLLAPARASLTTNTSLKWNRVYDLPDFAYFDHSIHVTKGIGCSTCHGRVDQMPITWKTQTLYMKWCLECHRAPENYLRPRNEIYDMAWRPGKNQPALGRQLVAQNHIDTSGRLTNCSTCHR